MVSGCRTISRAYRGGGGDITRDRKVVVNHQSSSLQESRRGAPAPLSAPPAERCLVGVCPPPARPGDEGRHRTVFRRLADKDTPTPDEHPWDTIPPSSRRGYSQMRPRGTADNLQRTSDVQHPTSDFRRLTSSAQCQPPRILPDEAPRDCRPCYRLPPT